MTDQDEDLLMYKPDLVKVMYELMVSPKCLRKVDLLKTLKNYAEHVFVKIIDINAKIEFNKLENVSSNCKLHLELVEHIKEVKSR